MTSSLNLIYTPVPFYFLELPQTIHQRNASTTTSTATMDHPSTYHNFACYSDWCKKKRLDDRGVLDVTRQLLLQTANFRQ